MDHWDVVIASYAVVALFALAMTWQEQRRVEAGRLSRLVGLVACTLWPLPLTAMIAAKMLDDRQDGADPH